MSLGEILIALLAAIVAEEVLGLTKTVSVWSVKQNAKRLPPEIRESYEEEWLRHLEELHSNLSKLFFALDLFRASYFIRRESRGFRRDRARIEEKTRPTTDEQTIAAERFNTLTPRQRQVLRLVISGRHNRQIAAELGVVIKTIKVHRARVMRKMAVGSLIELVHAISRLDAYPRSELAQVPLLTGRILGIYDEKHATTIARARLSTLTPRERQVLNLIVSGLLNKQIAAELGITEKAIKSHRARVMRKMAVGSLVELIQVAALAGVVAQVES
jgi:FixJ family two-component response regulator